MPSPCTGDCLEQKHSLYGKERLGPVQNGFCALAAHDHPFGQIQRERENKRKKEKDSHINGPSERRKQRKETFQRFVHSVSSASISERQGT